MKYQNMLDTDGIENLGVGFKTKEEMEAFTRMVKEEVDYRIGNKMSKDLTSEQLNQFDGLTDKQRIREWLSENYPEISKVIDEIRTDMKHELLRFRESISGMAPSLSVEWSGQSLEELEGRGLSAEEIILFLENGVETVGELYSMDNKMLRDWLKNDKDPEGERIFGIWAILERTRSYAGLAPRVYEEKNHELTELDECDEEVFEEDALPKEESLKKRKDGKEREDEELKSKRSF